MNNIELEKKVRENIIFQLKESFINESDRVERFSSILIDNLLDEMDIFDEDEREEKENELLEIVNNGLEDYGCVGCTDMYGDYECYYYDNGKYRFLETVEDFKDVYGIDDVNISFERLKEMYAQENLTNEEKKHIDFHICVETVVYNGLSGRSDKPGYTWFTAYDENRENQFDFYMKKED
jgi:hypothetical protein